MNFYCTYFERRTLPPRELGALGVRTISFIVAHRILKTQNVECVFALLVDLFRITSRIQMCFLYLTRDEFTWRFFTKNPSQKIFLEKAKKSKRLLLL